MSVSRNGWRGLFSAVGKATLGHFRLLTDLSFQRKKDNAVKKDARGKEEHGVREKDD